MYNARPYKWMSGSFPRRPGTTSPVKRQAQIRTHAHILLISSFTYSTWVLMNAICCQVLIWWGDSPCSRAQMSRRSATLEDPSSSAWARLHSYAPPSKFTAHLSRSLFFQHPQTNTSRANTSCTALVGRGCFTGSEIKWIFGWMFSFLYVDKLLLFMPCQNVEKGREIWTPYG